MSNSEQDSSGNAAEAFISNILKPGSSLHPNFLRILDGAFVMLLAVLLAMLWLSSGNLHVVALIAIELALWASVKWFVSELQAVRSTQVQAKTDDSDVTKDKSD